MLEKIFDKNNIFFKIDELAHKINKLFEITKTDGLLFLSYSKKSINHFIESFYLDDFNQKNKKFYFYDQDVFPSKNLFESIYKENSKIKFIIFEIFENSYIIFDTRSKKIIKDDFFQNLKINTDKKNKLIDNKKNILNFEKLNIEKNIKQYKNSIKEKIKNINQNKKINLFVKNEIQKNLLINTFNLNEEKIFIQSEKNVLNKKENQGNIFIEIGFLFERINIFLFDDNQKIWKEIHYSIVESIYTEQNIIKNNFKIVNLNNRVNSYLNNILIKNNNKYLNRIPKIADRKKHDFLILSESGFSLDLEFELSDSFQMIFAISEICNLNSFKKILNYENLNKIHFNEFKTVYIANKKWNIDNSDFDILPERLLVNLKKINGRKIHSKDYFSQANKILLTLDSDSKIELLFNNENKTISISGKFFKSTKMDSLNIVNDVKSSLTTLLQDILQTFDAKKKTNIKNIIKISLITILLISAFSVVSVLFRDTNNINDIFLRAFKSGKFFSIFFLSFNIFSQFLFSATFYYLFTQRYNEKLSIREAANLSFLVFFFANITPFFVGGPIITTYYLKRKKNMKSSLIGLLIFGEILVQIATRLILNGIMFPIGASTLNFRKPSSAIFFLILAFVQWTSDVFAFLIFLFVFSQRFKFFVRRALQKILISLNKNINIFDLDRLAENRFTTINSSIKEIIKQKKNMIIIFCVSFFNQWGNDTLHVIYNKYFFRQLTQFLLKIIFR